MTPRRVSLLTGVLDLSGSTLHTLELARHLRELDHLPQIVHAGGGLLGRLAIEKIPSVLVEALHPDSSELLRSRTILRVLEEFRPMLLHVQLPELAVLAEKVARCLGIPYLVSFHDAWSGPQKFPHEGRWFAGAVVPQEEIRESVVNDGGIAKTRTVLIRRGVATDKRAGREPLAANKLPLVGTVGPWDVRSGIETFLEAALRLSVRGIQAGFVLVGEGPDEAKYREKVREFGLEQKTFFVSETGNYPSVVAELDLVVFPVSRPGMGQMLMETMALGRAVVVPPGSGTFDLVEDRSTGFFIPPGNAEALADKLEALFAEKDAVREAAGRAREHVMKNFRADRMAQETAQLYAQVLEEWSRGAVGRPG